MDCDHPGPGVDGPRELPCDTVGNPTFPTPLVIGLLVVLDVGDGRDENCLDSGLDCNLLTNRTPGVFDLLNTQYVELACEFGSNPVPSDRGVVTGSLHSVAKCILFRWVCSA